MGVRKECGGEREERNVSVLVLGSHAGEERHERQERERESEGEG